MHGWTECSCHGTWASFARNCVRALHECASCTQSSENQDNTEEAEKTEEPEKTDEEKAAEEEKKKADEEKK